MGRIKYLMKNTFLFALGSLGSRIVVFLLVPLYTGVLLPEEYGIVDLLYTVCTILGPLITLNISEAIMRFCLDKDSNHNKILNNTFLVIIAGSLIGILIIPITRIFAVSDGYGLILYFCSLFIAVAQVFLYYLRGIEKPLLYSIGCIIQTTLIAIFSIIFLVVLEWGIRGYFRAYICANIITCIYCFLVGKINFISIIRVGMDKNLLRQMLTYSIAFIPNTFMWWIMNASDRVMVSAMIGTAANGIYSVSYKIPGLVSVCNTIFNQAWSYSAIKESDSNDRVEYTNRVFEILAIFSATVSIIILILLKPAMKVYVQATYYSAWKYSPILLLGNYFLILGSFVGSTTYTVDKNSVGMLKSGIVGSIPNIILNAILIPIMGIIGAAMATCFSYFLVTAYRIYDTRYSLALKWNTRKINLAHILMIIGTLLCYVPEPFSEILLIILLLIVFCCYKKELFNLLEKFIKRK